MKALLINGSPNVYGVTNYGLEIIKNKLEKNDIRTKTIWIGNNPIGGCIGCNYCIKNNNTCYMDDIVNKIIKEIEEYDAIILGSPVHFSNIAGNMKSMLDRLFYGRKNLFSGKVFASIVSARRAGTTSALDELNKYALMSNTYIVGSTYWTQIHGQNKEEAKKDLEGIETLENLSENIIYLLKCLELGKKNKIDKPNIRLENKTNFIR